ncbi:MAG: methylated-DNA--[protein]-cysteine S-methyltransferase [Propionibacteriaceae bacterium]|jgi:methylated-DNA-[protein]-cysteine S-methyltransferase|nr:methylated-DNA--[protein]-cysteine S-methyltransferase [Propionibacteriaceae bacterium]
MPSIAYATTVDTPDGPFRIIATDQAVIASGWTEDSDLLLEHVSDKLLPSALAESTNRVLRQAIRAVRAYYDGNPAPLAKVPVLQRSGAFREAAWEALRAVKPGETVSYGELAARAGNPRAARAAAGACSHNSVSLFVPCHRVIASGGKIGGYGSRLPLKRSLLNREAPHSGWSLVD